MDLKEPLTALGWHLSPEGLTQCVERCQQRGWEPTPRNIEKIAVDCDLRAVGEKVLSEDIVRNLQHQVEGPIVLQVQRVKNVVVPSSSKPLPSPARRLLRLHITDGHVYCSAVEMGGPIQNLSPLTPPGTKVRLQGKVEVKNGFLLLGGASLEHLGGQVEHLLKKWSIQEIVPDNVERSKAGTEGPPPFISFKDIAPAGKQPPQKQLQSSVREGQRSGDQLQSSVREGQRSRDKLRSPAREGQRSRDQKIQKPRFEDRSARSDLNKDERRHHRDLGRDKAAAAQTGAGRHDGRSGGYKPRQQHRHQDSRDRDGPSWTGQQQQRPERMGTSHRIERETRPSNAAADSLVHSTGKRDSHHQPRQRDDSRSYQRGSREESGRKTEYQLSDWLDQKLKLSAPSGSDSQHVCGDLEDEFVRDSLDVEAQDGVMATEREGGRSDYGRKEPWRDGREERGWREGDSRDGGLGGGGKRSSYDQPKEHYSRAPRFHQRRDLPSDQLDQKPKPGDFRSGSSRQYGSGYKEDFRGEFKAEVHERHVKTRGAGRGDFQKSESEDLGRKKYEPSRPHSTRPHSKERAERNDRFSKERDSGRLESQWASSGRQERDSGRLESQWASSGRQERDSGRLESQWTSSGRQERDSGRLESQWASSGRQERDSGRLESQWASSGRQERDSGRLESQWASSGRQERDSGRLESQWASSGRQERDSGRLESQWASSGRQERDSGRLESQWASSGRQERDSGRLESQWASSGRQERDSGRLESQWASSGRQERDSGRLESQWASSGRQRDQERDELSSQRHDRDRGGLASHPRARDAGREGSHSRDNAPQGELGSGKYSWEWVNKGAPCGATKQ